MEYSEVHKVLRKKREASFLPRKGAKATVSPAAAYGFVCFLLSFFFFCAFWIWAILPGNL
jgi:hypothetical protein